MKANYETTNIKEQTTSNSRNISIIIPTYNRPDVLDLTIDTYCRQNDVNEIIILDDASNISYSSVIDRVKTRYPQLKIIYKKSNSRKRQALQKELGCTLATGKFIMFGEDDVFLADNYTKILKSKIISNKDAHSFYCGQIFYNIDLDKNVQQQIETKKEYISPEPLFNYESLFGNFEASIKKDEQIPFGHSLYMAERRFIQNIEFFTDYKGSCFREESDTQLQLLKIGLKGYITPDTFCCHLSGKYTFKQRKNETNLLNDYHFMKSNRLFWQHNIKTIKKYVNASPHPFKQIIAHNYRFLKHKIKA